MSRKPRADSKLKMLPEAAQEELYQFLRYNTQEKTLAWLKQRHGVDTSASALSQFFVWYPSASLRPAAQFADQLKAQFEKMPQLKIDAEQLATITQTAFEIQAAQDRDPKLFFALRKAQRDARKLQLDERKVKLLEAKAALADKAKEIAGDRELSPEEQLSKFRQIFGGQ